MDKNKNKIKLIFVSMEKITMILFKKNSQQNKTTKQYKMYKKIMRA